MYIKSPLNYTGNKYKILNHIIPKIEKSDVLLDLFCGSGTVGINAKCKKVYLNDIDKMVVELLKALSTKPFQLIQEMIYILIEKYKLSDSIKFSYSSYITSKDNNGLKSYNKEGFLLMRSDYNELKDKTTFKANVILYLLMVYGFNNDIRFNSNGDFNIPVGKTDFNNNNFKKLKNFNKGFDEKEIVLLNEDFNSSKILELLKEVTVIYVDPPYLITNAVYNKSTNWDEKSESNLYIFLTMAIKMGKKIILSNLLFRGEKQNNFLIDFININNLLVTKLDLKYSSSSYNKKDRYANEQEVLVTNFEIK